MSLSNVDQSCGNEGPRSSVRVACGEVAGDLGAFVHIATNRHQRRRRAGPVGLLEAVIAAVEAGDHAGAALACGRLCVDQRLHLVTPFVAVIIAADAAEVVQGAEDFGQPLQIAIERRSRVLRARGGQRASEDDENDSRKAFEHDGALDWSYARPMRRTQGGGRSLYSSRRAAAMISGKPSVSIRPSSASGRRHWKSSSSSLRRGSPVRHSAANDMMT